MSQRILPIDANAVFLRLRSLVEMYGGQAAVARDSGLPLPTLETYMQGKHLPGSVALAQLSRTLKVSADFILFGEAR